MRLTTFQYSHIHVVNKSSTNDHLLVDFKLATIWVGQKDEGWIRWEKSSNWNCCILYFSKRAVIRDHLRDKSIPKSKEYLICDKTNNFFLIFCDIPSPKRDEKFFHLVVSVHFMLWNTTVIVSFDDVTIYDTLAHKCHSSWYSFWYGFWYILYFLYCINL